MKSRTWWAWGTWWVVVIASASAAAQPRAADGRATERVRDATVVQIDGGDVYIDVGRGAVSVGASFEVLRPIETRHPLTRAVLRDRFPIGRLVVVQVGETLSIARVEGTPHRAVSLADLVRMPRPDAPPSEPTPVAGGAASSAVAACPPAPAAPECVVQVGGATDVRAIEILRVWSATFGLLPESRVRVWTAFLATSASSPYARYASAEIGEAQRELARARAEGPTAGVLAALAPLGRAFEGEPVAFAGIVSRGVAMRDLSIYVRPRGGTDNFKRVPMVADATGHVRAAVPAELVVVAGFEWFGEITLGDGRTAFVAGGPSAPIAVAVWASPSSPPLEDGRSRVRFSSEYVDFNRLRGNDYYVSFEGDFAYRLGLSFLPSVRVGYGHLQGESGNVDDLDVRGLASREVGFTYGYVEPELSFTELFAMAVRFTAGLGLPERRTDGLRGGVQLRFRVGRANGTNLVLAGETIPELGLRGYIGLAFLPVPNWPMGAEVHVTDQPGNGQIAVRGVFEVGHRFGRAFALSTRLSYQGRNIDHSGFGVGLAATFDW